MIVRVPEKDALAALKSESHNLIIVMIGSGIGLILIGGWLGRSISKPLVEGIGTLRSVGSQVTLSATQIAASSSSVAEGASEQAASLEETSASLEEIAAMTRRNAESAQHGSSMGRKARESATAGLDRLNEMGRTLDGIKGAVNEMQTAVVEIQSSSQEVAKIIKTIDEIAFQTNILALNAAVEAARAGEAGMGFAVVADEVRALAQRSAQAAKDTSEKIEAAIRRSEFGGAASSKVVKSLSEVEVNAAGISEVFQGIVSQVSALDEVINQIASGSQEQSQGIGEVNMAAAQMDKVTQHNAASAEENASAAEGLSSQARSLQEVVTGLELVVTGGSPAAASEGVVPPSRHGEVGKPRPIAKLQARPLGKSKAAAPKRPTAPVSEPDASADSEIPMPEVAARGSTKGGFTDF